MFIYYILLHLDQTLQFYFCHLILYIILFINYLWSDKKRNPKSLNKNLSIIYVNQKRILNLVLSSVLEQNKTKLLKYFTENYIKMENIIKLISKLLQYLYDTKIRPVFYHRK